LDAGFYPWDYFPYYAEDYYPYDYYTGYDAGVDQAEYGDGAAPSRDQHGDANVVNVQSRLANLGYYRGAIDGFSGPATRAALNRYQIDRHLRVTGTPTTGTLQSLGI
jgi:peptidoglycan hydrolase-like protein with peptidoglycan-binding domain